LIIVGRGCVAITVKCTSIAYRIISALKLIYFDYAHFITWAQAAYSGTDKTTAGSCQVDPEVPKKIKDRNSWVYGGIILHGPLTRSLRPAVWTGSAYSASVQAPSAVYVAITDLRVVNFKPRQTIHVLNARHYQTGI